MKTEKQRLRRKSKQKKGNEDRRKMREPKLIYKTDSEGHVHLVRNPWYQKGEL